MSLNQSYTEPPRSAQPPSLPNDPGDLPHWAVWKLEPRSSDPDDLTKVPYSPITGRRAKANDVSTFGSRLQADEALATDRYTGLCFLIDAALDITVVDLDDVVENPGDDLPVEVWEVVTAANTYTEWSPSRTGLHLIFAGVPHGYKNRTPKDATISAEAYWSARFMTFTGDQLLGTPAEFNDNIGNLTAVLDILGFEKRGPKTSEKHTTTSWEADDEQLLRHALRAANGAKLQRLLNGDTSDYPESQGDKGFSSEADAALVGILAFWTQDSGQIARIWRGSKLYREKLDRDDYIERTIAFVLDQGGTTYDPNYRAGEDTTGDRQDTDSDQQDASTADDGTAREELRAEIQRLTAMIEESRETIKTRETVIERERAMRKHAEAQLETLRSQKSKAAQVLRNPDLSAGERLTGFALALELGARVANGEMPGDFGYNVPSIRLAEMTGQSEQACARHLREFDKRGVVRKRVVREAVKTADRDTGEVEIGARDRNYIDLDGGTIIDLTERLATYQRPEGETKHGGLRKPRCSDHPDAGTVKKWHIVCAEPGCGKILDRGETYQKPDEDDGNTEADTSPINLIAEDDVSNTSLSDTNLIPEPDETPETGKGGGLTLNGSGSRRCWECRTELEAGQATLCRSCAAKHQRERDQAKRVRQAGTRFCAECGEPTATPDARYCPAHGGAQESEVAS